MGEETKERNNEREFTSNLEGYITNAYNGCGDKLRTHLAGTIFIELTPEKKKLSFDGKTGKFVEGGSASDCQISTSARYLEEISAGDLNPQIAMLTDKVKVSGDVGLAVYFFNLIAPNSNN